MIELYHKNHSRKGYTLVGLFREIKRIFNPERILYPGCYVHITPSLIFPDVTYVDSFRDTYKFYENLEVKEFIEKNRDYKEEARFKFYYQDYFKDLPESLESFDVVISLYGGFAGQAVKKYLKKWGILVCNDSHGDASIASIDADYELISVYNKKSDDKYSISNKNLDEYLIPKKNVKITREFLEQTMKGAAYTKTPSGYIFRKK